MKDKALYDDIYNRSIECADLSIKHSKVLNNFHTCRGQRIKLSIRIQRIFNEYVLRENISESECKKLNKKEVKEIHKELKLLIKKSDDLDDIRELLMLLLLKLKLSIIEVLLYALFILINY